MTVDGGSKRKRSGRACDRCHRNACRCSPGVEGTVCSRCKDQGVDCTYERPVKRRGPNPARRPPPSRNAQPVRSGISEQNARSQVAVDDTVGTPAPAANGLSPTAPSPVDGSEVGLSPPQVSSIYEAYEDAVSPNAIKSLVDVFYHTIYPIRPYFHWPTFRAQVSQQLYRSDWGVFVVTMALCALTAGRLYDGIPSAHNLQSLRSEAGTLSSTCYFAAIKAMPRSLTIIRDYCQGMKAHALLASVCLQNGDLKATVAHLGDYTSLSICNGFHDECKWPENLSEIDKQERRRLFWAVYQQEQYISSNFGLPARQSETRRSVHYPAAVYDDEDITSTQIKFRPDHISFLQGWNFCSDLYRLLEHIQKTKYLDQQSKMHDSSEKASDIDLFISGAAAPRDFASDSLHLISKMHKDLPQVLKSVQALTGSLFTDRYSFVAANILFTTQNMKMLIVESELPSINRCCDIASDLLDELSTVPLEFFQAISTSSLHHLSNVGQLLGRTIRKPLSAWRYIQVRNILLLLADFLDKIESSRFSSASLTFRLRSQISAMDNYMQQISGKTHASGLLSIAQSLLLGGPNTSAAEDTRPATTASPPRSADIPRALQEPSGAPNAPSHLDQLLSLTNVFQNAPANDIQGHQGIIDPSDPEAAEPECGLNNNVFTFPLLPTNQTPDVEFDFGAGLNGSPIPDFFVEGWPNLIK